MSQILLFFLFVFGLGVLLASHDEGPPVVHRHSALGVQISGELIEYPTLPVLPFVNEVPLSQTHILECIDRAARYDRIDATGYNWQTCGENIAAGQPSIRAAVKAWLASPGHCANIMDPDFEEMGLGMARNADSDYGIYWTQVFGTTF